MIRYDITAVTKRVEKPVEIECDICHKVFNCEEDSDDVLEVQEFHHIEFRGGYGSIFGDESWVECDICQHCLKTALGQYLRISE